MVCVVAPQVLDPEARARRAIASWTHLVWRAAQYTAMMARNVMIMMAHNTLFPTSVPKKDRVISMAQWMCPHPLSWARKDGNGEAVYWKCGKCRLRLSYQPRVGLTRAKVVSTGRR